MNVHDIIVIEDISSSVCCDHCGDIYAVDFLCPVCDQIVDDIAQSFYSSEDGQVTDLQCRECGAYYKYLGIQNSAPYGDIYEFMGKL